MADVLRATYADLKTVKTRSTCQVILELPIEALTEVVALLGAPVPGNEVWVAIARLRTPAEQPVAEIEPPLKRGATLAQIAGIICNEGAFQKFVGAANAAEAAEFVRGRCNVSSRANIDHNPDAMRAFKDLKAKYDAWMLNPELAA